MTDTRPCETCGTETPTDELTTFAECANGATHCRRCHCQPCAIERREDRP